MLHTIAEICVSITVFMLAIMHSIDKARMDELEERINMLIFMEVRRREK